MDIQDLQDFLGFWIPTFVGMTVVGGRIQTWIYRIYRIF